ncbi:MAG: 7-cyano-7-deazaguanine synthase QueC [Proteiniphilum sp.]|jgi:7-cyano-7-deazaguanine synthase|nr:7-cyano-7-deazaguanine synthase QueC [Proteiniphilum sp.]
MNDYKKQDALLLFSGGQDSTTCLYWAKQQFANLHALCIAYGQRHAQEVENARRIAQTARIPFRLLHADTIPRLAPNSLTDASLPVDDEIAPGTYPNTFVPGRNLLFLTCAATLARAQGIRHLVIGVSEADYSGYPDCREAFIRSACTTLSLAMDHPFEIHTPLMWRSKKEVWQLADELGVFDIVRNETLTCYNGLPADGCGHCPACRLRRRGLQEYLAERSLRP